MQKIKDHMGHTTSVLKLSRLEGPPVINWDPEGPWSGLQVLIYSYRFRFTKDAILINIMLAWSI